MDSITDICYDYMPNKEGRIREEYIEPLEKEIKTLQSENARLQAERGKAVEDLENLIDCHCACNYCANLMPDGTCEAERKYGVCTCLPKWRGVEE